MYFDLGALLLYYDMGRAGCALVRYTNYYTLWDGLGKAGILCYFTNAGWLCHIFSCMVFWCSAWIYSIEHGFSLRSAKRPSNTGATLMRLISTAFNTFILIYIFVDNLA